MKNLKKYIGEYLYTKYIPYINYMKGSFKKDRLDIKKEDKKIVLTLTPNHGNLGDHAIAYASKKYIEDKFKGYEIIELDMFEIYKYGKVLKNILTSDDYIFTLGGGNMGNLYHQEEWTRRFIIKNFKNINIVSLPQTINFTEDKNGEKEFNKTKLIYNSNKKLTLIAREKKSFEIMKNAFPNSNVIINPDMVFYLSNMKLYEGLERSNIMICLRQDKEGYITSEQRSEIIDNIKRKYNNVIVSDTVIRKRVNKDTREKELKKLWEQFYQSKVVVTDRLHGMIFAVITKTPCVVIRNTDHKITGSYEWIKNLNYIKLIDDFSIENINKNILELENIKELGETYIKEDYFDDLVNRLKI